jgi:flagellar hook-length control protein FliK
MRITGNPQSTGAGSAAPDNAQANNAQPKSGTRFSEVLKDEKRRETAEPEKPARREPLVPKGSVAAAPALAQPIPFSDIAPVDVGHGVASQSEVLVASLVQEIAIEAPPGGSSVDIQFDSRTLDGLHVRVQKKGDSVEVRFSTSSEAVSRLLTANAHSLAEALVQRGYVAPTVSVQRAQGSAAFFAGDSRRSRRDGGDGGDGGDRGRHDQRGGQKRG